MSKWSEAAKRYSKNAGSKVLEEREVARALEQMRVRTITDLHNFFGNTEGRDALRLLEASEGTVVVFSDYRSNSQVSFSHSGIKLTHRLTPDRHYEFDFEGAKALVNEFIRFGNAPEKLLPLIGKELDRIADAAPK